MLNINDVLYRCLSKRRIDIEQLLFQFSTSEPFGGSNNNHYFVALLFIDSLWNNIHLCELASSYYYDFRINLKSMIVSMFHVVRQLQSTQTQSSHTAQNNIRNEWINPTKMSRGNKFGITSIQCVFHRKLQTSKDGTLSN